MMETNILAGRFEGQRSPSLSFLYLDGSYATHRAMVSLRHIERNEEKHGNFLSHSRAVGADSITWSWMRPVKKNQKWR